MLRSLLLSILTVGVLYAQPSRPTVSIENPAAVLAIDLAGGSLVDFHLKDNALNPFAWEEKGDPAAPRPRGHFLCLDRWGAPSEAERRNNMPFHGEAARVMWKVTAQRAGCAEMEARLPMAGISVRRVVQLANSGAIARVSESVTNTNPLGRVYNMVQHPTIGPPFLDETTLVDANARKGFMQSSPLPNPEEPAVWWPQALRDGETVNLRYLRDDPAPNVVSYTIDEEHGWTTAVNPGRGLLVGYIWPAADYSWFNAWRHVENGKPFARGLEFGTTGLHQPFPVLIRKGTIFGRSILAYLDADETVERSYAVFLSKAPADHPGVARVVLEDGRIVVNSRGRGRLTIETDGLPAGLF